MNKKRDIESISDTIGINLNSHMNFGSNNPPSVLTPITIKQSNPENVLDNMEKKCKI